MSDNPLANFYHKSLINKFIMFAALTLVFTFIMIANPMQPKAEAVVSDGSDLPWWALLDMQYLCDLTDNDVAQYGYVSLAGNTSAVSTTITNPGAIINLQYNVIVRKCKLNRDTGIISTTFKTKGGVYRSTYFGDRTIPALVDREEIILGNLNNSALYSWESFPFSVNTAGMSAPGGDITGNVNSKQANWFTNGGVVGCVVPPGAPDIFLTAGMSIENCPQTNPGFRFRVDIDPPDNNPSVTLNASTNCSRINITATDTQGAVRVRTRIRNNSGGWDVIDDRNNVNGNFEFDFPAAYKDAHRRRLEITAFNNATGSLGGGTNTTITGEVERCHVPVCTSVTTNPGSPEVGNTIRIGLAWSYTTTPPGGASARPVNPRGQARFQTNPYLINAAMGASTTGGAYTFPNPYLLNNPGSYTADGNISYIDALTGQTYTDDCANNGSAAITAVTKPYFRIYGNDAMAGGYFADAASPTECTGGPVDSLATFQGFNAAGDGGGANPTGNYLRGAGSQHALFALGQINSVASSANRNFLANATNLGGNTRWPTRQTFANYGTTNYSPNFGGSGGISRCIPDFYSRSSSVAKTTDIYDLKVGNVNTTLHASPTANQLVNINGADITVPGLNQTVYIDGDAKIADGANIIYNDSVLDGFNDVPNLTIVVKGDLYIDDDTTRLDGTYIVQPYWDGSTWKGGRLITCYESAGAGRPFNNNELPTNCNKKLEINGAVISQEIILLRTNGNYSSNPDNPTNPGGILNNVETPRSNNIAEVFNFSPEIYLNPANFTTSSSTGKYDAINVLPPTF
jgi:hypothetical protein